MSPHPGQLLTRSDLLNAKGHVRRIMDKLVTYQGDIMYDAYERFTEDLRIIYTDHMPWQGKHAPTDELLHWVHLTVLKLEDIQLDYTVYRDVRLEMAFGIFRLAARPVHETAQLGEKVSELYRQCAVEQKVRLLRRPNRFLTYLSR